MLGLQRDIATSQYDVAHTFPLFLPQITRFLAQPRRVGLPSRHRHLPIRHSSRFSPFLTQNTRFLAEPRRVGGPTRRGCLPTRRGAPFYIKKPPALYEWLPAFFILTQMSNLA